MVEKREATAIPLARTNAFAKMRAQVATRGEGLQIVENDGRKLRVTDRVGRD